MKFIKGIPKTDWFFIILIFSLPLVSLPFIFNPNKVGKELFIVLAVGLWSSRVLFRSIKNALKYSFTLIDVIVTIFIAYFLTNYACQSFYSVLYNELWVFVVYVILYLIFRSKTELLLSSKRKNGEGYAIPFVIVIISLIESFIAILQYANLYTSDNIYFKSVGTFVNPNFLGVQVTVGSLILLYVLFSITISSRLKLLIISALSIMLYVLWTTQSRASWFSLLIGIGILLLTTKKAKILIYRKTVVYILCFTLLSVSVFSFFALYKMGEDSVNGRLFAQKLVLARAKDDLLFGNGIFNFSGIYNKYKSIYFTNSTRPWAEIKVGDYISNSLNDLIQILFEIGIVGLILVLLIYILCIKYAINAKLRLQLTILVTIAIMAMFTSIIYNPCAIIIVIWAVASCSKEAEKILKIGTILSLVCNCLLLCLSFFIIYLSFNKGVAYNEFSKAVKYSPDHLINKQFNFIVDDPFVEFKIGFKKFEDGYRDDGVKMMENSVKKSMIPDANVALANIYSALGETKKCENLLLLNVGIEPSRFKPRANLLYFYRNTRQYKKAIRLANTIVNLPVKIHSEEVDMYKAEARKVVMSQN